MTKFKKLLTITMAMMMSLAFVGCGEEASTTSTPASTPSTTESAPAAAPEATPEASAPAESGETPDFVTVNAKNGEGEFIDMQVPYNPSRVTFMDYVSLDMCISLGLIDDLEYITVTSDGMPPYLQEIFDAQEISLGGLKGYQEDTTILPTILEFEPELIFTSGRSAGDYESFMEVVAEDGGVVSSSISYEPSTYDSFKEINMRNASIFGKENEMADLISQYDARLEALSSWGEGKTAVVGIFTGGSMNLLGSASRCSMIFNDLGFENVGTDVDTGHGDSASYEAVLAANPDFLFILDRDSAIGTEGASLAMDLLDNEIIQQSDAWKNGNVVELDPLVWYLVEGGVTAMETMLSDLEVGMNK